MLNPKYSYDCYWNIENFYKTTWISQRMSKLKFLEILHCCSWDVDGLFSFSNKVFASLWRPATTICIDEMMIPYKGSSPHHVFVPRKPHPHGMKVWSAVDSSLFIYNFQIYKRTSVEYPIPPLRSSSISFVRTGSIPRKTATDTVLRLVAKFPPGQRINSCDSYFGSLDLVGRLSQLRHGVVCSCRKDRPTWLFKEVEKFPSSSSPNCYSASGILRILKWVSRYSL